jgi:hypothetical protein
LLCRLGLVDWIRVDGLSIGGDAWSWGSVDREASLPGFFQSIGRSSIPVLGRNNAPERSPVCLVDLAKTLLINVGEVHWVADHVAVESERWVGCGVGESTARWGGLRKNSDWVAEGADRTIGGGSWKERGSSGELDVDGRARRVGIVGRGGGLNVGRFVDGRRHGGHDRGLSGGARAG